MQSEDAGNAGGVWAGGYNRVSEHSSLSLSARVMLNNACYTKFIVQHSRPCWNSVMCVKPLFFFLHAAGLIIQRCKVQPLGCFIFRGGQSYTAAEGTRPSNPENSCVTFKCARKKTSVPYCVFLSSCFCFSNFTHVFMLRARLPCSALGIIKAQESEQNESSGWWVKNRSTWQTLMDSHPLTFQIRGAVARKPYCSSFLI